MRYNVSFSQTALLDIFEPLAVAQSSPIVIDIYCDDVLEGFEYFQARIVETSDFVRVRIDQDTVNVNIINSESLILSNKFSISTEGDIRTYATRDIKDHICLLALTSNHECSKLFCPNVLPKQGF